MEITSKDIQDLVKFGMTAGLRHDQLLKFENREYINGQHWSTWEKMVTDLSDYELSYVYKSVITLERELKWLGGSVAGAIWLYRIIRQRSLDDDYSLADYGLRHSNNSYVPFGSSYHGERNIQSYFLHQKERSRRRALKFKEDKEFHERVKDRRKRRSAAIAELRKLSFKERGSIREKYLEEYRSATIQERLETIASDEKYPPEYYPPEWINLTNEQIRKLPTDILKKLLDKLSTKAKGEWKRFSQKLQIIDAVK